MGLRVVILAGRKTGYLTLKQLIALRKHEIVGVFSKEYKNIINDNITCRDFKRLLSKAGVPFWNSDSIHAAKTVKIIKSLRPDIGLSIGWRRLVREPVISIPRMGFINFHASDLPRYRGFASTSWAILEGDSHIAISAHRMIPGRADEGDIYLKKRIRISKGMDIGGLFGKIEACLPSLVCDLLDRIESGKIKPQPQNEAQSICSLPRVPYDGWIDWAKPARQIDRLVRAVAKPYPGAFTCWKGKKLFIWEGHVLKSSKRYIGIPGQVIGQNNDLSIKVLTGKGIYVANKVQLEGSKICLSPGKIIRGRQQRLGLTCGELFHLLRSQVCLKVNSV